jgi:outer membrane murein-binding lipoprotein Lpp
MSTTPKLLLAVVASSTLLFGCSTPQHGAHWEYKTVSVSNTAADAKLNELAADGWSVVDFSRNEGGSNQSTFVLKRKK